MSDWDDQLYNEAHSSILHYLDKRREGDPEFSRETLKDILADAYKKQGHSWAGKSPVEEIKEAATIAAFEQYLSDWKE